MSNSCKTRTAIYSETSLRPTIVLGVWFIQDKLTKIYYIGTLFKVWLIQDSALFRVQSRQVLLYIFLLCFTCMIIFLFYLYVYLFVVILFCFTCMFIFLLLFVSGSSFLLNFPSDLYTLNLFCVTLWNERLKEIKQNSSLDTRLTLWSMPNVI